MFAKLWQWLLALFGVKPQDGPPPPPPPKKKVRPMDGPPPPPPPVLPK